MRGTGPAREPATFVFADLAGFTALTEAHGDAAALEIATRFQARVRELLPGEGAEVVKTIGDEVMIRAPDAGQAVELGLRIVEELAMPGAPPVRVGMHSGPAIGHEGDWFGATVNLASRIAGAARPGEVLLTEATRDEASGCGLELEPRGPHRFKHIHDPVPVFRVARPGARAPALEIDPVCRMAVDAENPAATRALGGDDLFFCSGECAARFDTDPGRYVDAGPPTPQ